MVIVYWHTSINDSYTMTDVVDYIGSHCSNGEDNITVNSSNIHWRMQEQPHY